MRRRSSSRSRDRPTHSSRRSRVTTSLLSTSTRRISRTSSCPSTASRLTMLRNVFLKSLRDLRRGFVWWSIGLAGMSAMMVSVYPTVRGNAALDKLVKSYPDALKGFIGFGGELDYTSAAGYLGIELFSLVVPDRKSTRLNSSHANIS